MIVPEVHKTEEGNSITCTIKFSDAVKDMYPNFSVLNMLWIMSKYFGLYSQIGLSEELLRKNSRKYARMS